MSFAGLLRMRVPWLTPGATNAGSLDPRVVRLRAGDLSALGDIYDEHHPALCAFAQRLLGDTSAADDLVQEVFVALPQTIRRFEGRSSLATYLVSVAINHARHHVRASSRRRRMLERFAAERPSAGGDPERSASDHELAERLFRALDGLPLDQRVAFVLCEIEERTSVEAAGITGVTEGTVRVRMSRARAALRERFRKEDPR